MLPFYDTRPLMSSVRILPSAGATITLRLKQLLIEHATLTDQHGGNTRPLSAWKDDTGDQLSFLTFDVLENLKVKIGVVAETPKSEVERSEKVIQLQLEGGATLTFPKWLGEEICEVLFQKDDEDDRSIPIYIAETLLGVSVQCISS
jgi:hypothetical protein